MAYKTLIYLLNELAAKNNLALEKAPAKLSDRFLFVAMLNAEIALWFLRAYKNHYEMHNTLARNYAKACFWHAGIDDSDEIYSEWAKEWADDFDHNEVKMIYNNRARTHLGLWIEQGNKEAAYHELLQMPEMLQTQLEKHAAAALEGLRNEIEELEMAISDAKTVEEYRLRVRWMQTKRSAKKSLQRSLVCLAITSVYGLIAAFQPLAHDFFVGMTGVTFAASVFLARQGFEAMRRVKESENSR